jgi:hypothetical protein
MLVRGRAHLWSAAAWLGGCLALAAAGDVATPGEISGWIGQLASPQFARREAAARHLIQAGLPAIGPLRDAIGSDDLEVASRSVEIVGTMLASDDATVADAAEQALEACAADESRATARLAAAALEFHVLGLADQARATLETLGAVLRERPLVERRGLEVEINASWRGTTADLRHVGRLRGLDAVSIHGVLVDDDALEVLAGLEGVQRIDLFGTGAGREAAQMLARHLPDARIDVRKGGRLGVSSQAFGGPCEVRTVEPGSAADQAGLRSGDVVVSIDGEPVASFDELTVRLADCAPGEVVRLVVLRSGGAAGDPERIECEVRLDAW